MTHELKTGGDRGYLRIATEEAFGPQEMFAKYREILQGPDVDPGFRSLWGFFLEADSGYTNSTVQRLIDIGERRIADMDATGIDVQLLSLTAPGVQVLDTATARSLAVMSNDRVAEACRDFPDRFAALTAIPPQDPAFAAKELERGMTKLGLKGAIINSHTQGEYLDQTKFWPIFEAAEALDAAIYIHPQTLPHPAGQQFVDRNLDLAIMGFAVEVAFHTLAIIVSGAFDRFPRLKIVIGHGGEGLPFWIYRMDYMQDVIFGRKPGTRRIKHKISHYLRNNIWITTSGMAWEPAISFTQQVLGFDRVLYAMDYPYQYDAGEVRVSDNLPISAANKKKFYQTNAQRVFNL